MRPIRSVPPLARPIRNNAGPIAPAIAALAVVCHRLRLDRATRGPFHLPAATAPPAYRRRCAARRRREPGGAGAGDSRAGLKSCASCVDTYALTGTALSLRGSRYRDGGTDPAGFDCSGFTQYVFGQHGIALPRDVKDQFGTGKPVQPADIAPGDLIFFTTVAPGASHVAIALGGDEFVHAPSSTGVVRVEHLASPYWSQRFLGARRLN